MSIHAYVTLYGKNERFLSVDFELIKREIILGGPDLIRIALLKRIQAFPEVRDFKWHRLLFSHSLALLLSC